VLFLVIHLANPAKKRLHAGNNLHTCRQVIRHQGACDLLGRDRAGARAEDKQKLGFAGHIGSAFKEIILPRKCRQHFEFLANEQDRLRALRAPMLKSAPDAGRS
jgi:hypothetical protein